MSSNVTWKVVLAETPIVVPAGLIFSVKSYTPRSSRLLLLIVTDLLDASSTAEKVYTGDNSNTRFLQTKLYIQLKF